MPQPKEGELVHVEFHSNDPQRTKRFYTEVFGYKFEEIPAMNYTMWKAHGGPAGGLMKAENRPPTVLNYLLANDIERTLAKVSAAGGAILQPKMEIQGQGWWALFQEPGGTVMALFQGLPMPPKPARKPAARKAARKTTRKPAKGRRKK